MAGGRPLQIDWHSDDTAAALQRRVRSEPDRHVAKRLQALWRLRTGTGIRETAGALGVAERSLQRWLSWYRAGGLAAVSAHRLRGPGRTPRLSREQQAALCDYAATGALHTAWDALDWVTAQYGVSYRRTGIYSLLQRLHCRPKVPRPSNPSSSAVIQADWKKGGSSPHSARRVSPSGPA